MKRNNSTEPSDFHTFISFFYQRRNEFVLPKPYKSLCMNAIKRSLLLVQPLYFPMKIWTKKLFKRALRLVRKKLQEPPDVVHDDRARYIFAELHPILLKLAGNKAIQKGLPSIMSAWQTLPKNKLKSFY